MQAVVSGEKDRGRAPQADPTGSEEEDPLSQVKTLKYDT